jgi:hypothetical protein
MIMQLTISLSSDVLPECELRRAFIEFLRGAHEDAVDEHDIGRDDEEDYLKYLEVTVCGESHVLGFLDPEIEERKAGPDPEAVDRICKALDELPITMKQEVLDAIKKISQK